MGIVENVGLIQIADARATARRNTPGVRLKMPRQNLHERGFTVAVATHNADAVALINADGHPLENSAGRELKVQRFAAK